MNDDPDFNLEQYEDYDSRIIVVGGGWRKGQPTRLNEGIRFAIGKYITFQDADDISYPKRLELSLDFLKKRQADGVVADSIYIDFKGKRHYAKSPAPTRETVRRRSLGNFGSILIKKSIADQVQFDSKVGYGNDHIWSIGIMAITEKIYRMPLPVYLYRHYATTYWNRNLRSIPIIRKLYRIMVKRKLQKRVIEELNKFDVYRKEI